LNSDANGGNWSAKKERGEEISPQEGVNAGFKVSQVSKFQGKAEGFAFETLKP
jgi:hypothetical protein